MTDSAFDGRGLQLGITFRRRAGFGRLALVADVFSESAMENSLVIVN